MKSVFSRGVGWPVAGVVMTGVLYWAFVARRIDSGSATATATVVAAIATAVAAVAAMQAARQSSDTARRAGDALAKAIEPVLHISKGHDVYGDETTPMEVVLYMMTTHPAVDLRGEVVLSNGRRESFAEAMLPGEVPGLLKGHGWRFRPSGQDGGAGPVDIGEVTVTFSDEMRLVRYEQVATWSGGGPVAKSVKRVLGPS